MLVHNWPDQTEPFQILIHVQYLGAVFLSHVYFHLFTCVMIDIAFYRHAEVGVDMCIYCNHGNTSQ